MYRSTFKTTQNVPVQLHLGEQEKKLEKCNISILEFSNFCI